MKFYFDVTTIMFDTRKIGIPRVVLEFSNALEKMLPSDKLQFVYYDTQIDKLRDRTTGSHVLMNEKACFISCGAVWNYQGLLRILESGDSNILYVHLFHDIIPVLFPHFYESGFNRNFQQWCQRTLKRLDGLLSFSNSTISDLMQFFPNEFREKFIRSKVVKPGLYFPDVKNNSLSHLLPGVDEYILFVGTLESRKNVHFLLDCFRALKKEKPDFFPSLVMVGGDSWLETNIGERIKFEFDELGCVYHLKNVQDDDLVTLYKNAKFTVQPSLYEGYGLTLLESLYFGTPCIASDIAGMREVSPGLIKLCALNNFNQWKTVMYEWSKNSMEYLSFKNLILKQFKPTSWESAAHEVITFCTEI